MVYPLTLLLIRRHFWQSWPLQQALFFFLSLVQWLSARGHKPRGHENNQIAFDVLIHVGAKQPSNQRNVTDDRRAIFRLLHILSHQPTKYYCLPVPHAHVCGHFARAENRLVNHVFGEQNRWDCRPAYEIGIHPKDWAPVINEPFKLDHLRHQVKIDGCAVWADNRFHLERHTGISSFKCLRGCWRNYLNRDLSCSSLSSGNTGYLRRRECGWIPKFPDNFDDGALPAFGRHLRR